MVSGHDFKPVAAPKDILIACISRRAKSSFRRDPDSIRPGDTVIVVTTAEKIVRDLNDIF